MVFDISGAEALIGLLKEEVHAPFVSAYKSTLGGAHRVSVMLTISVDPRDAWSNGILENSRYVKLHIHNDGTITEISGHGLKRFRKTRFRDLAEVVDKINRFLTGNV